MTAQPEPARRSLLLPTVRVAYRFVAGRDLDGGRRTTATFRHPGDALGPHRVWWFQHHPGHRRARFRLLSVATVTTLVYVDFVAPTLFWWLVAAAAVVAVPSLGISLWKLRHDTGTTGDGSALRRSRWMRDSYGFQVAVEVPRRHLDDPDHPAVFRFPPGMAVSETEKKRIAQKAADKLGFTDFQAEWNMVGRAVLRISTAPLPPQRVNIANKTHVLENKTGDG